MKTVHYFSIVKYFIVKKPIHVSVNVLDKEFHFLNIAERLDKVIFVRFIHIFRKGIKKIPLGP